MSCILETAEYWKNEGKKSSKFFHFCCVFLEEGRGLGASSSFNNSSASSTPCLSSVLAAETYAFATSLGHFNAKRSIDLRTIATFPASFLRMAKIASL